MTKTYNHFAFSQQNSKWPYKLSCHKTVSSQMTLNWATETTVTEGYTHNWWLQFYNVLKFEITSISFLYVWCCFKVLFWDKILITNFFYLVWTTSNILFFGKPKLPKKQNINWSITSAWPQHTSTLHRPAYTYNDRFFAWNVLRSHKFQLSGRHGPVATTENKQININKTS